MLTYAAIFVDDPEKQRCHVSFPNLNYECDIDYENNEELLKAASEELSFAVWLCDDRGQKIPKPKTISDERLPNGAVINFVSSDYERYKQSLSVRVIDLSD